MTSESRMGRSLVFAPILATVTLVALAAFPPFAGASTVSLGAGVLTITAGPGEANAVIVEVVNASPLNVSDTGGITPGPGCEFRTATRVYCGAASSSTSIVVSLGDGNDTFTNQDASSYTSTVDADGGPGDDRIDAVGGANHILRGGDGNDTLSGSSGDDQVFGEGGNDSVRGYGGADTVSGGPGVDLIEGDGSPRYLEGGSDTIDSRDGERDTVNCGFGTDSVRADVVDVIDVMECESVDRAGSGPAPAPDGTPGVAVAAPASTKLSKLLSRSGSVFFIKVSAPCKAAFRLTVAAAEARRTKLGSGAVTLASASGQIPRAGTFQSSVKPAIKYRTKLRALTRVVTTLSVSCSSGGKSGRDSQKITFRR